MNWILLSLSSAIFLGLYDIAKKSAVRNNAVPPVLLLNVVTAFIIWSGPLLLSQTAPQWIPFSSIVVESINWQQHGLLAIKSLLVGVSWILALYALKHLPISVAAPIRATSPLFTILVAVVWMGERPGLGQWAGVTVILASFYAFSVVSSREGIQFHRDRWVGCMMLATVLGASSALFDKYLLQTVKLRPSTVQAWFSAYLVLVMIPLAVKWYRTERLQSPFEWRWSIPMIAVLLLISDFLYFSAIEKPDALISLISPVRRISLIISFMAGILLYGEKNWRPKAICITGLLIGVYVLNSAKTVPESATQGRFRQHEQSSLNSRN